MNRAVNKNKKIEAFEKFQRHYKVDSMPFKPV